MKYGKSLYNQIEGAFPEWKDHFLSYKQLKKKLKFIEPELDFIALLEAEVNKFNDFFEEKQEDYVIAIWELKEKVGGVNESSGEMVKIRNQIVNFHGEMVLLENYSAFNFIGLVKILKKYDKRTGNATCLPFIQNKVLEQPFFTMDLLYDLIKQCEDLLDRLFPLYVPSAQRRDRNEPSDPKYMQNLYMRSAVSALRILKEIRSGSSTKSKFSLPPFEKP